MMRTVMMMIMIMMIITIMMMMMMLRLDDLLNLVLFFFFFLKTNACKARLCAVHLHVIGGKLASPAKCPVCYDEIDDRGSGTRRKT